MDQKYKIEGARAEWNCDAIGRGDTHSQELPSKVAVLILVSNLQIAKINPTINNSKKRQKVANLDSEDGGAKS